MTFQFQKAAPMENKRGYFITLEGTEGVGKSTNLAFICEWLRSRDIEFIETREPGGTPLAEELRQLLLANRAEPFDPTAELLTVFAARAQHLAQVIRPALESGKTVVCDRFTDATYAYQGAGRGLDKSLVRLLEQQVQGQLQPDLTVLLDIDPRTGLERAAARSKADRFENEKIAFFERVRAGYRERAETSNNRFAVIDAGQPLDKVQADLAATLEARL
ncbi:dTMP kinase [Biformimicrobium ophioploci]|nr:dTMP kinase [Microbulbifer sp. NKW57]